MINGEDEKISIGKLLCQGVSLLKSNPRIDTPRLDCEVLLSHILQKDRVYLAIHCEEILPQKYVHHFYQLVHRRRNHEPVSYIIQKKEFMSLSFFVTEGVLIPRPDTEILVESVIEKFKDHSPAILDLCTGSGAIAVSLAKYIPLSTVWGVDISEQCLDCAKENALFHDVADRVIIKKQNVLGDFTTGKQFDCIVSNPPYIPSHIISTLDKTVKDYEPLAALDGGKDGLIFYRHIIKKAPQMLKEKGLLAFEVGHNQAEAVMQLLIESNCFENIEVRQDLSGISRVLHAAVR